MYIRADDVYAWWALYLDAVSRSPGSMRTVARQVLIRLIVIVASLSSVTLYTYVDTPVFATSASTLASPCVRRTNSLIGP